MITILLEFLKDFFSFEEFYIDYTDEIQDLKKELQIFTEISDQLNVQLNEFNELSTNLEKISLEGLKDIKLFSKEDWTEFDEAIIHLMEKNINKFYTNVSDDTKFYWENTLKLNYDLTEEIVHYNQSLLLWEHTNQIYNISNLLNNLPSFKNKNSSIDVLQNIIEKQIHDNKLSSNWKSKNFLIKLNSYNLFDNSQKIKEKEETLIKIQKELFEKTLPNVADYLK